MEHREYDWQGRKAIVEEVYKNRKPKNRNHRRYTAILVRILTKDGISVGCERVRETTFDREARQTGRNLVYDAKSRKYREIG